MTYRDLLPLPGGRDGCPARERFRELARFGDVVVTVAGYADYGALRACRTGSGRDIVLGTAGDFSTEGNGTSPEVVAGGDGRVVIERRSYSRYEGCLGALRQTIDVETGAVISTEQTAC